MHLHPYATIKTHLYLGENLIGVFKNWVIHLDAGADPSLQQVWHVPQASYK